jgi:hypothetical protein
MMSVSVIHHLSHWEGSIHPSKTIDVISTSAMTTTIDETNNEEATAHQAEKPFFKDGNP